MASEDGPLPEYYGPPRVSLLAVDPYHVCAYWDVNVAALPEGSEAVLRFQELGAEATTGFEMPVDLAAKRSYVDLWSPDKTYYVDLGLRGQDGRFALLARSGAVHTPRAWPVAEVGIAAATPVQTSETLVPAAPLEPEQTIAPTVVVNAPAPRMPQPVGPARQEQEVPRPRTEERPVVGSPAPIDAAAELHTRLTAIYGGPHWTPRFPSAPETPEVPPAPEERSPGAVRPHRKDLTKVAEERFLRGAPSSPGGSNKPVSSR